MDAQVTPLFEDHGSRPGASATVTGRIALLTFFIDGKPEPKGRPRAAVRGGHVQMYTPETTLNWEQNVGWQVKQQLAEIALDPNGGTVVLPLRDRVLANLRFNFEKPASASKAVQYPVKSRTDVDNLAKAILDALQNVGILANDNIVTDLTCCKRFVSPGHPQGVEIELTAWQ